MSSALATTGLEGFERNVGVSGVLDVLGAEVFACLSRL